MCLTGVRWLYNRSQTEQLSLLNRTNTMCCVCLHGCRSMNKLRCLGCSQFVGRLVVCPLRVFMSEFILLSPAKVCFWQLNFQMTVVQKEPQQQFVLSAHTCRSREPTPRFPSAESVKKKKKQINREHMTVHGKCSRSSMLVKERVTYILLMSLLMTKKSKARAQKSSQPPHCIVHCVLPG